MLFAALALAVATAAGAAATARVDAVAVPTSATAVRAGGELSDEFWQTVAPTDAFVQREPEEGGVPSQRTEFRVAYDATTLFVKVRAFDTDAGKIVSYLTRRDGDSPSRLDPRPDRLVSRQAHRLRVRASTRPASSSIATGTTTTTATTAGTRCGTSSVSRDAQRLDRGVPHSVFAAALHAPATSITVRLRRVAADRPAERDRRRGRCCARSANGYVSSFGELGGLSMGASPKKLELVPYTVANLTRQRPEGNPLLSPSAPDGAVGLDMKYAVTPGLTLTGDGQSGFRPGRGRSGGRQPVGVRDLLHRAPAVLRRRIRQLQLRRRLQGRRRARCSTRAASAARRTAPTICRAATPSTPTTPPQIDDPRRGEADRARRQVLDRRDVRGDPGGDRDRRATASALPAGGRADDQLHDRPRAARVRQPVVDRRDDDVDQPPAAGSADCSCPSSALHRRRRLSTCASRSATALTGFSRRQPRQRRPDGDRVASRKTAATTTSARTPISFALDPTRTSLSGGQRRRSAINKIGGQRVRFKSQVGFKSPGLRSQRRRLPAPRRRALAC